MATTSTGAQRNVPAAPDTTKPASLTSGTPRTPTAAVTGPSRWENSRQGVSVVSGPPPLCGSSAASAKPPQQG